MRRKKKKTLNPLGIIILITVIAIYVKITFLNDFHPFKDLRFPLFNNGKNIEVVERSIREDYSQIQPENRTDNIQKKEKYVEIFFVKSLNGEDVYTAVLRLKQDWVKMSDVEFAVSNLLKGPSSSEKNNGMYSEIPYGTKLLSVKEDSQKVIINLSADFEFGGGGDSLYKRVYQLIKTVNKNTAKPVYLFIDGRQADIIGGEGLMLKQPLKGNSLND